MRQRETLCRVERVHDHSLRAPYMSRLWMHVPSVKGILDVVEAMPRSQTSDSFWQNGTPPSITLSRTSNLQGLGESVWTLWRKRAPSGGQGCSSASPGALEVALESSGVSEYPGVQGSLMQTHSSCCHRCVVPRECSPYERGSR